VIGMLRGRVLRVDGPTSTVRAETEIGSISATVLSSVRSPDLGDTVLLIGGDDGWAAIDSWESA